MADEEALFWPDWQKLYEERKFRNFAFARALGMSEPKATEYAETYTRDDMPPCLAGG